jgi:hypothetical protein
MRPYVGYHQQRTCRWIRLRRLSAKRRPEQVQQMTPLFDLLVSE